MDEILIPFIFASNLYMKLILYYIIASEMSGIWLGKQFKRIVELVKSFLGKELCS